MQVIPAPLTPTVEELYSQMERLSEFYSHFQIDIVDGLFAPNTTQTITQIIEAQERFIPLMQRGVKVDFDLMVTDYKTALHELETLTKTFTIQTAFLHFSTLHGEPLPTSSKFTIGIALDLKDSVEDLDRLYNVKQLSAIQIMTVTPGFQGSPFVANMLQKIDQLRKTGYRNPIYIDGSVNDTTIPIFLKRNYKPDYLGIGSFLTKAQNLPERVAYLNQILG